MPTAFGTLGGLRQLTQINPRNPFTSIEAMNRAVPQAFVIDGTKSRDPDNTGAINVLRAGLVMGRVTSTLKYATCVIGVSNANAAAAATTITLTPQAATEVVRRIGASGTFTITGTHSATVHQETVTYSAVNTTSGAVTCTAITNAYDKGAWVGDTDGSQNPRAILAGPFSQYGIDVTDLSSNNLDQALNEFYVSGDYYSAMVINLTNMDSVTEGDFKTRLRTNNGGVFTFDDDR